jgi:hypothetical protein
MIFVIACVMVLTAGPTRHLRERRRRKKEPRRHVSPGLSSLRLWLDGLGGDEGSGVPIQLSV